MTNQTETNMLTLPREALVAGMDVVNLLVTVRLAESASDARRLIRHAEARLNGRVVAHEGETAGLEDLDAQGTLRLSAGRPREALVWAA